VSRKNSYQYVKVHRAYLDSGEEIHYLLDSLRHEPIPATIVYAIERRLEVQSGTIETEMRGLAKLYEHAKQQNFDLDSYLRLDALKIDLFNSFLNGLYVYLQTQRHEEVAGAIHSVITPSTFVGYWITIRNFILRRIQRSIVDKSGKVSEADIDKVLRYIADINGRLGQYATKSPPKMYLPILREPELYKVMEAFHPSNDTFEDEAVKLRNWAFFLLLCDGGLRVGSALGLYVSDVPRTATTPIQINRRPDNPKDTRQRRMKTKSRPHSVILSDVTVVALNRYITECRLDYAGTPFLFLNGDSSAPWAYPSVMDARDTVKRKTGIDFSPHTLRRTRHYNRLVQIASKPGERAYNFSRAKDIVCIEGGWSQKSGIPEAYINQFNIDEANKIPSILLEPLVRMLDEKK